MRAWRLKKIIYATLTMLCLICVSSISAKENLRIRGVPIACINRAAVTYLVPATLIISILTVEGGAPDMASPNKNGTFDYGPMQINSIWLPKIAPYGYTRADIQYNPCVNVMVGAWILSNMITQNFSKYQHNYWTAVASYHSQNPRYNAHYRQKVLKNYQLLHEILSRAPSK